MKRHLPLAAIVIMAFATASFAQPQATASPSPATAAKPKPRMLIGFSIGEFSDSPQGGMHHFHGESHSVRELRIQQQKLRHAQGAQLRGVGLAVGFEGGATAKQPDLL